ncbi:MAG: D-lyxose/D-mannose family sugar isomerase [Candidatus Lokiarchaeota archaeon]|nr:D-lyxose/D-mannose family sugar isomerase [Candidatus Lokiarchaeota archaeon]
MRRSQINIIMKNAVQFFKNQKFYLPKFAYWSLDEWISKGKEIEGIIKNHLGWDITDFGSNDFSRMGLILFTIRNGNLEDIKKGSKPYCEKIMIMEEDQILPMHYHYNKIEDIINRGGGILTIKLFNPTKENTLSGSDVQVFIDGIRKTLQAGSVLELEPGESITLDTNTYHKFQCKQGHGKVLIGEVSTVNDDYVDNQFLEPIKRFSEIEEDEEPLYLLYDDYNVFFNFD